MASMLPAWPDPPEQVAPSALWSCLGDYGVTSVLRVGGQSEFVLDGIQSEDLLQAQRVGSLWIRGHEHEWMEGEALKSPMTTRPGELFSSQGTRPGLFLTQGVNLGFNGCGSVTSCIQHLWCGKSN